MSAELAILLAWAMLWLESVNAFIFGRIVHTLEYQSRNVTIPGRGRRARSTLVRDRSDANQTKGSAGPSIRAL